MQLRQYAAANVQFDTRNGSVAPTAHKLLPRPDRLAVVRQLTSTHKGVNSSRDGRYLCRAAGRRTDDHIQQLDASQGQLRASPKQLSSIKKACPVCLPPGIERNSACCLFTYQLLAASADAQQCFKPSRCTWMAKYDWYAAHSPEAVTGIQYPMPTYRPGTPS